MKLYVNSYTMVVLTTPCGLKRVIVLGNKEKIPVGCAMGTDVYFLKNRDITETLRSFSKIGERWDGESAVKIRPECIYDAVQFLGHAVSDLREQDIEFFPTAMPEADGSVSLYFERGNFYAEFGFDGSGSYYYFIEDAASGEDISIESGFPLEFFSNIYKNL